MQLKNKWLEINSNQQQRFEDLRPAIIPYIPAIMYIIPDIQPK